jgi:hypothetical protein
LKEIVFHAKGLYRFIVIDMSGGMAGTRAYSCSSGHEPQASKMNR